MIMIEVGAPHAHVIPFFIMWVLWGEANKVRTSIFYKATRLWNSSKRDMYTFTNHLALSFSLVLCSLCIWYINRSSNLSERITNSSERIFYLIEQIFFLFEGFTNSSERIFICSNDLLIRPNESFICSNDLLIRPNEPFICLNESFICSNESFICSNEPFICSNELPIRQNEDFFFGHSTPPYNIVIQKKLK